MRFFNEDLQMFISVVRTKLVGISRSRVLNISPALFKSGKAESLPQYGRFISRELL